MPIQTDPTRTSHPPAPKRSQPTAPRPPGTPLRDSRRLLQSTSETQKTGSQRSRCLAKSPFSLGKKSRGGEKWGSGPESLPRSPGLADAKRGGERGGRTHPGPPMACPRLPQPSARLRARSALSRAELAVSRPRPRRSPWAGLAAPPPPPAPL